MPAETEHQNYQEFHKGDRVEGEYSKEGTLFKFTGTIALEYIESGVLFIQRDDGVNGSGPRGEWKCKLNHVEGLYGISSYWGANEWDGILKKVDESCTGDGESERIVKKHKNIESTPININTLKDARKKTEIHF